MQGMETLRAYLTPKAKKQRLGEEEDDIKSELSFDEMKDDEEGVDEDGVHSELMKTMRQEIRKEMLAMIRPINDSIEDIRRDVSNMRMEMGLVQAEVEDATTQAGLSHGAAEEATNLTHELDIKVTDVEKSMATLTQVKNLIEETISKKASSFDVKKQPGSLPLTSRLGVDDAKIEKFKRTTVVGGFDDDMMKTDVEAKLMEIMAGVAGVEDHFAYRRGSIGFVRFVTTDDMWMFIRKFNDKDFTKPTYKGKTLWAAVSRSPADRRKGKIMATYKKVLVEVGLADVNAIDFDARRGMLWAGRTRIAEWVGDAESGTLTLNSARMKDAGMDVKAEMVDNAVKEALGVQ